jgi:hypothetical protein
MVQCSIQVSIGVLLSLPEAHVHHRRSGSPFVTQIGVGKVIKGWDEGEKRRGVSSYALSVIVRGVPQLSVGQKATLTATSDYVSPIPLTASRTDQILRPTGCADSLPSFLRTLL